MADRFVMGGSLQKTVEYAPRGYPGQIRTNVASTTGWNSSQESKKKVSITVSGALPQIVDFEGVSVSVEDTDTNLSDVEELYKALGESPYVSDVTLAINGSSVEMESVHFGWDFQISVSSGLTLTTLISSSETPKLPMGRIVARRSGDGEDVVRLPSDASDIPFGILGRSAFTENDDYERGFELGRGEVATCLRLGEAFIECEEPIQANAPLYYRYAPDSTYVELGRVAQTAGSGKASLNTLGVYAASDSFYAFDRQLVLAARY